MISIEMPCAEMNASQIATLAKIPTLVMFGDHLSDVQGGPQTGVRLLKDANVSSSK